ncbi:MAG TPA: hypothetical protein VN213_02215 [Solirubrobacteraceae bacterium]|nr:hypothetical protein [Solirubrobacteraceae bacterium]
MTADAVRAIADAVLYEGYLLWPYRRSATKNRRRWTFGGVYPPGHAEAHPDDPCVMRAACLLEDGGDATVEVQVRFLHVVERAVGRDGPAGLALVDELTVGDRRFLAWEEAAEREIGVPPLPVGGSRHVPIAIPGDRVEEDLLDPAGRRAGAIVRSWEPLDGAVEVAAERVADGLARVSVTIANGSASSGGDREAALRRTFCSTHAVLRARGGAFVSQTDPPRALRDAAAACRNEGCWPVLVGEPGERQTVLASPIILEDHPRIAPESPGDLFDGGEIDQLLVLNILSLTDAEKAEMRDTDPRAREILERTEALTPEQLMRLHGAIREFGTARR